MSVYANYAEPESLPASASVRIAKLLGLTIRSQVDDVALAMRVADGLATTAAEALGRVIGKTHVVGPVIPEATYRRAKKARKPLSREMSERLYEISRVVDAVGRIYHGDEAAITRFLTRPHQMLHGKTPLALAQSGSAGAEAVINMIRKIDSGFAV